jgi:hypothetical protein
MSVLLGIVQFDDEEDSRMTVSDASMFWLPAFLAPLAVFFHVVSLRQAVPRLSSTLERQPS